MGKEYLSSGEAARALGVAKCTLLRAVRRGDVVPAQQTPGGYLRFLAADVAAYGQRLSAARRPRPLRATGAPSSRREPGAAPPRGHNPGAMASTGRPVGTAPSAGRKTRVMARDALPWLLDISRRLNKARALDEVLDVVYDGVRDGLDFDRVGINLFDHAGGIFDECIGTDAQGRKTRPMDRQVELADDSPIWRFPGIAALLRGADVYYTADAFAECPPELRFLFDGEPAHNIMVALHSGDAIIGMISVDNLLSKRPILPRDAAPLVALANQVGTAVERARAHARAENLAHEAEARACELADIVADQRRLMRELEISQQRLRRVYEALSNGVVVLDREGRVVDANAAAEEMLGVPLAEMRGLVLSDSLWGVARVDGSEAPVNERPAMVALRTGQPAHGVVIQIIRPDGERRWLQLDVVPLLDKDGVVERLMISYMDLTPRVQAEEALQHQALHDALTNLPNRVLLHERLQQALRSAKRVSLALLLIDLNRFKEVNDTLGHHCGDLLLREVGARIKEVLRASDTVARLGGDEFAVLLPSADAVDALSIAERVLDAMDQPFLVEGQSLDVGGSIGIALSPDHGADAATLLRCADVAMYEAKRSGGGFAVYDVAHDEHSLARLSLSRDLRHALDNGDFLLHYQPLVDLAQGRPRGVEALIRWRHPERGVVPPDQFIPLAEQTGLIGQLTLWVLEEALRQCGAWRRSGLELDMAVNLSVRTLHDPCLPDDVATLLQRYGVAPARLTLEITESTLMADRARVMATLLRLHDLGVRLAIDDFGTGYSSLAYLKQLPVDEIKIDKSFILGLREDSTDEPLVRSITAMARVLGLEVVAEGVETPEAWQLLRGLDCMMAQGYYMSRPLPAADLERWARTAPWHIQQESA